MQSLILLVAFMAQANALKLLLSSYGPAEKQNGAVDIVELKESTSTLTATHTNKDCGGLPTWLDQSLGNGQVTCIDEADPGSLNLLKIQAGGNITKLSSIPTVGGPVKIQFYNGRSALALAHYTPPAITTYRVTRENRFIPLQNISVNTPAGPNQDSQATAHIHDAVLDPTRRYMVFPNLGSDLVHVYRIERNSTIAPLAPIKTKPGYGPRHATFWKPDNATTFLFVVHEFGNRVTSYKVSYGYGSGISFAEVDDVSTFGSSNSSKEAAAGEIALSPDNKFLSLSNRLSPLLTTTAPNGTQIPSDTIATFKPTTAGKLEFVQLAPSGGISPRHFSFNRDGSKIAIANFQSRDLAVYERDVGTGKLGKLCASGANMGAGSLTCVRWLEE